MNKKFLPILLFLLQMLLFGYTEARAAGAEEFSFMGEYNRLMRETAGTTTLSAEASGIPTFESISASLERDRRALSTTGEGATLAREAPPAAVPPDLTGDPFQLLEQERIRLEEGLFGGRRAEVTPLSPDEAFRMLDEQSAQLRQIADGGRARRANRAPYDPRATEQMAQRFGRVERSTVPNPSQSNVRLAGQHIERIAGHDPLTHESIIQRVVFDQRGFPIFDPYVKVETRITGDLSHMNREAHMRAATRQLRADIEAGRVSRGIFDEVQLRKIMSGEKKIPGYTWHHHQETGRMQLVPTDIHEWIKHVGGTELWGME
jgi:hypothetical protein